MMSFSCEKCLYSTDSKFCFESHKKSKTHIQKEKNEFVENYQCKICNKTYKSRAGLWRHKKKCEEEKKRKENEEMRNIVTQLLKDNKEIKSMLNEISKKEFTKIENIHNSNSHNTNSHNKIDFNIFLNEKCKNAINMSSLIETIVFGLKDIQSIEKYGYVKTITNLVVEKINNYSVYERPLHYYIEDKNNDEENDDEPNETIHIKENDRWNKEDPCEHDLLLTNMNTINDVLQEKTKGKEPANQEVKSGRRYNKTGKIITNILETVKINDDSLKEL
jgi:hypothetical protein